MKQSTQSTRSGLLLVTIAVFALSSCVGCGSFSSHAKTIPTTGALDPAIAAKILRAQADVIEKQNDPNTRLGEFKNLNDTVTAGIEQAKNDCKQKGFAVDAKGDGAITLNGLNLTCIPKPPTPTPTAPAP